jgi:hypothetical protein
VTLGLLFWILMLFWLFWGVWSAWPNGPAIGGGLLPWLCVALLGWHIWPIHG